MIEVPNCPQIPSSGGVEIRYAIATLPAEPGPGSSSSQCCLLDKIKSRVTNTLGFPTQPAQPAIPAHRVGSSPLSGLGMFATRNIKQGDLILSERALIIFPAAVPYSADVSGLSAQDLQRVVLHSGEKLVERLFDRMNPGQKKAYMSLHNSHKLDGSGPLFGVARTNGYKIVPLADSEKGEGDAGAYSGVFDQLSRINHSCGSNTTRRFHMPSFSMRLYATRDIRQGEEITANYDSVWESTALRQAQMDRYGFRCTCSSCSNA
ncbi:SET domain-containing protein, partial [Hymenopellis radicata]